MWLVYSEVTLKALGLLRLPKLSRIDSVQDLDEWHFVVASIVTNIRPVCQTQQNLVNKKSHWKYQFPLDYQS